ncbi:MAG: aldo/keto reductase [Alphaproteobacteria bacterium]|jgi:predicted oxidoreductase|nr:aldo/keto reductase [Alphaproteobacteria bacterium]
MNNNFKFKSRLAWGNWRLSDALANPKNMAQHIESVFKSKIFVIDTADIYGNYGNEEILGNALKDVNLPRESYQVVTKGNIFKDNPSYPNITGHHFDNSYQYLKNAIERSLQKLQTPYIDLYLLHRLDYLMNPLEVAKVLKEYVNAGKIKAVGVSNFPASTVRMLQKYLDIPISTNQIEFSLKHLDPLDDGSLDLAIENSFQPMLWSPYARGDIFKDANINGILEKYAAKYATTPEAIATAWLLKHPSLPVIVVGSNNLQRIQKISAGVDINLENYEWYDILKSTGKILP